MYGRLFWSTHSNQSKELSSLLERSIRKTKENLESGITEIVSAHLMFGDTLCRNLGQVFAKTLVGNCPSCPPATYAPDIWYNYIFSFHELMNYVVSSQFY